MSEHAVVPLAVRICNCFLLASLLDCASAPCAGCCSCPLTARFHPLCRSRFRGIRYLFLLLAHRCCECGLDLLILDVLRALDDLFVVPCRCRSETVLQRKRKEVCGRRTTPQCSKRSALPPSPSHHQALTAPFDDTAAVKKICAVTEPSLPSYRTSNGETSEWLTHSWIPIRAFFSSSSTRRLKGNAPATFWTCK